MALLEGLVGVSAGVRWHQVSVKQHVWIFLDHLLDSLFLTWLIMLSDLQTRKLSDFLSSFRQKTSVKGRRGTPISITKNSHFYKFNQAAQACSYSGSTISTSSQLTVMSQLRVSQMFWIHQALDKPARLIIRLLFGFVQMVKLNSNKTHTEALPLLHPFSLHWLSRSIFSCSSSS